MSETPRRPRETSLLTDALAARGFSQTELARRTGIPLPTVRLALRGIRSRDGVDVPAPPSDAVMVALASELQLTPPDLAEAGRPEAARALERKFMETYAGREDFQEEDAVLAAVSVDRLLREIKDRFDRLGA